MIVILAAMEAEIRDFKRQVTDLKTSPVKACRIYTGKMGGRDCLLVLTGVGRRRAQQAARFVLENYPVSLLISTGFAGALNPDLAVGDIVVYSCLDLEHEPADSPPQASYCRSDLVELALQVSQPGPFRTLPGRGVSVSQVCAAPESKLKLAEVYQADAVDMESYWIAEIAREKGVDFLTVRSISDSVRDDLSFLDSCLEKGKFKLPKALAYFLGHPAQLKKVAGLSYNFRKSGRNLAVYLSQLVHQLP